MKQEGQDTTRRSRKRKNKDAKGKENMDTTKVQSAEKEKEETEKRGTAREDVEGVGKNGKVASHDVERTESVNEPWKSNKDPGDRPLLPKSRHGNRAPHRDHGAGKWSDLVRWRTRWSSDHPLGQVSDPADWDMDGTVESRRDQLQHRTESDCDHASGDTTGRDVPTPMESRPTRISPTL